MVSSKRNNFKIVVTLDNNSVLVTPEHHTLEYRFSNSHTDKLVIDDNTLTISGDRSGKPKFSEIFTNHQSEIYIQIIKSYIYYCILSGEVFDILEIKCYDKKGILEKKYTHSNIRNLSTQERKLDLTKINKLKAAVIFKSSADSNKYFYAMSTLIHAHCSKDNNNTFEKLWKSYNSIYRKLSAKSMEYQCLEDMGKLINSTPAHFPLSINAVKNLTSTDITNHTRWRKMLENKFITRGNVATRENNFSKFLQNYNDYRLNEIAKQNIDIERNFWTDQNLKTLTETTINGKIATRHIQNTDLVDVLCNHYAYFLRNTILHGEQADHSFRFIPNNKEEISLNFISQILFALVCDLINSHTL